MDGKDRLWSYHRSWSQRQWLTLDHDGSTKKNNFLIATNDDEDILLASHTYATTVN